MSFTGTLVSELLIDGSWVDYTSRVLRDDGNGIKISRRPVNGWGDRPAPTTASWIYKNLDNELYGRNPSSSLYGKIGRNTRVRHRLLMSGDTFDGRTVASGWSNGWSLVNGTVGDFAVAANVATQSHSAVNALHLAVHETNVIDHDITVDASWDFGTALTASATQWVVLRYVDTSNYIGALLSVTTTATVTLQLFRVLAGSFALFGSPVTVGTGHVSNEVWRVRARVAFGWLDAMAWRPGTDTEPSSWQAESAQITDSVYLTATKAGLGSRLEAGNTNTLPRVSTFNSFQANSFRFWGRLPSFSPQRDSTGKYKTVPVLAGGLSQQLQQGARPLRSALTRAMDGVGDGDVEPVAHWPLEDAVGTKQPGNLRSGGSAQVSGAVAMASFTYSGASGSTAAPVLSATGAISGVYPPVVLAVDGSGRSIWQVQFMGTVPSSISGNATFLTIKTNDTGGDHMVKLQVEWDHGFKIFTCRPYDRSGVNLTGSAIAFDSTMYDRPLLFGINLYQPTPGGSIVLQFGYWLPDGSSNNTGGVVGTGATTVMPVPQSWLASAVAANAGWSFSHHALYTDPAVFDFPNQTNNADALDGFDGELSGERVLRLGRETSTQVRLVGNASDTNPCGPQRPGSLIDNLTDAADADQGVLADDRDLYGLVYITRTSLLNTDTTCEFSHSGGHDLQSIQIVDDDRTVRNKITATRIGGSFSIAEITEGPTSTNDPPDGLGEYPESLAWLLHSDEQTFEFAGWRAHIKGWDEPRVPATAVWRERDELIDSPVLDAEVLSLDLTRHYSITDMPADLPPEDMHLLVQGYDETLAQFEHRITLDGLPAGPYTVLELDDTTLGRTTDDHFLRTAVNTSATSWEIANQVPGVQLSTGGGWQWKMDGELVSVTSVAAPTIAFVGVGTASTGASGSRTPGLPAGIVAGNLALILASTRNSGTGTVDDLANWYTMWEDGNVALLARIYDGVWSMPTVTYTGGAANEDTIAQSAAFSGKFNDVTKLRVAFAGRLNSTAVQDISAPGIPITDLPENLMAIHIGWKQDDYTSVTAPGSWNKMQEASSAAGNDASQVWSYRQFTSRPAAASLQPTFTVTGGATAINRSAVILIASDYALATVVRSQNGISKSHSAGAVPQLTPAPYLAM